MGNSIMLDLTAAPVTSLHLLRQHGWEGLVCTFAAQGERGRVKREHRSLRSGFQLMLAWSVYQQPLMKAAMKASRSSGPTEPLGL